MNTLQLNDRAFWGLILVWALASSAYGFLIDSSFFLTIAGYTSALAIFALSINVMLGGIGEVPLGQSLFYGIGAYGIGICMKKYGFSFEAALIAGVVFSTLVSCVLGAVTLRLTGAYFSIVSWGLASVATVIAINLEHFTGGGLGLFGLPAMRLLGWDLAQPRHYFFAATTALVLVVIFLHALRTSRVGAAFESVRQNPHLSTSLGIHVFRQRMKAFVLSAALASLAGGLTVPYTQIVTPDALGLTVTVDALLMVLLGGSRSLFGPIIGAVVFSILPFYLEMSVTMRMLVFSVIIIAIMMFMPGGLHQLGVTVIRKFDRRQHHVRVG